MSFDTASVKKAFFDKKAVRDSVSKGVRQALSKFGAFVRTRAKSSIRKRKGISAPGDAPSSHVGTLKRLIFFSFDKAANSVVIGPVLKAGGGAEAPKLLEYGGAGKRGRYIARPFMRPAFAAELPNAPKGFKNSIK